ncbi:MAG: leucyl aminopeptidase [Bacteroidota bacterium]|nr:leucyl aminopeptidase [Bacteroidota bacterium]
MKTLIKKKTTINKKDNLIILTDKKDNLKQYGISEKEHIYIKKVNDEIISINQYDRYIFIVKPKKNRNINLHSENCRLIGDRLIERLIDVNSIVIIDTIMKNDDALKIAEGMALSNYTFDKYKKEQIKKLKEIHIVSNTPSKEINELNKVIEGVYFSRDLINEPFSHLKAIDLAAAAKKSSNNNGFKVKVLLKKEIENLKMGGLLAVNQGSLDEPTFTIMEWKPKNAKNKQPIVLVGKGIVYDTGGLSLKPTKDSMDLMKVDMGGAGIVIGTMQAISANKLPVHVIGLAPATDNRPSGNAYAPGDVITMYDKTTVEVLNTDAEGRLILADALSYAKKYDPQLVIDLATLTGSAANSIGHYGIVSMHKGAKSEHEKLKQVGHKVHERLAEMPFWSEYDDLIKSDIADIKNIGGTQAGAITAGKFLSHFVNYPWIHLDIAGPTFTKEKYGYRGKGATGMGVRLLYEFIKNIYEKN